MAVAQILGIFLQHSQKKL